MKSFKEFIAEEGEAPITTTANVEPKDAPNIRKRKKKLPGNAGKWVAIGTPISKWGYSVYGIDPDANISGDASYGMSGGESGS